MGQYYKPVFLNKDNKPTAYANCYDFGSLAKLMEHSWMLNDFVGFIERQLSITPQKLVWAGDYADNESPDTLTNSEVKQLSDEDCKYSNSKVIFKEGVNLYTLCQISGRITHSEDDKEDVNFANMKAYKYLINHDKGLFVDKSKVPSLGDGWRIHPLPLLTAEGNNRGGGDFRGEDEKNLVGSWSRDCIGVVSRKSDIPKHFKEIIFDLKED